MTFIELYQLMQTFIDKAGSSYFPPSQFDKVGNALYNAFVENELDKLEKDEEYTSRVSYLYKVIQKLNSDRIIESVDCPNFRKRIRINAKFRKDCNGVITHPTVGVIKARNNEIDQLQVDPFNKGDDTEPLFLVTELGGQVIWQVFSATTPVEINVTYCRNNQIINSATAPNTVFEAPNDIAEQIVSYIASDLDNIIENFGRSNARQQLISRFISTPSKQVA